MDLMQSLIASKLLGGGGGSEPILKTKSIYENGTYSAIEDEADGYSSVTVNVPTNVTDRALTVNGTFSSAVDNKDGYSNVTVNVQEAPVKTTSLSVTENGTYEPGPASELSLTIPTIPDEVETEVSAGVTITNFDDLRIEFINKTTGVTGHVDIYPSAIATQQIPMSFKNRTLIMGPDENHYITIVNGYDSIIVLQKGYTITAMKLTSYSGYFDEVTVDVPPTVLEHLIETINTNGTHTFTPETGVDGFSDASITVDVQPNTMEKPISANGTYIAANDNVDGYSKAIVNVPPEPITEARSVENLPQPIASFNNGAEAPITSLKVAIEPQQDLHGYDSPWVGGAGKNKLGGSPNIGKTFTIAGIIWTVNQDGSVKVQGTATERSIFYYFPNNPEGYLTLNGSYKFYRNDEADVGVACEIGGVWKAFYPTGGSALDFDNAKLTQMWIDVSKGATVNTTIYPMICLSSVTDTTWTPYSNICPISGHTEVNIANVGNANALPFFVGLLKGTHGFVNLGDLTYNYGGRTGAFSVFDLDKKTGVIPLLVNDFNVLTTSFSWRNFDSYSDVLIGQSSGNNNLYFKYLEAGTEPLAFKTAVNGKYLIYELETPTTPTITPTQFVTLLNAFNLSGYDKTIDLDGTHYGGEVDVVNGGGTDDRGYIVFDGSSDENWVVQGTVGFYIDVSDKKVGMNNYIANNYIATNESGWDSRTPINNFSGHPTLKRLYFRYPYEDFSADLTAWRAWLASNNIQVVYELATPTTYETQPTPINSLKGDNNVYANTVDINDLDYIYVNDEVGTLINKTITANGSYCAVTDDNADGYLNIDVNVEGSGGDIYKYHWSNDGKICVREGLGEYVWFFIGYTKETSDDVEPPEELVDYFPAYCGLDNGRSVIYGQAYAAATSTTADRYIGFYNNKIRTWNSDLSQLISGTFYGVIYITPNTDTSSDPQMNEYTSPTDVPISDITLIEKTITENGTYSAEDDGYVGYSDVVVNVPSSAVVKVNKYAVVNNRVLQSVPVAFEQGKYYAAFYYDDYLYPRSGTPNKLACFTFTRSKAGETVEQTLMNYNNYNIVWYYTDESLYLNNKIDNDTVDAYVTIIEIDPSVTNPLIPS